MTQELNQVTAAVEQTIASGAQPSVLEIIDERCAGYISDYQKASVKSGNHLIAQTDGAGAEAEAKRIQKIWSDCGLEVKIADETEDLIAFRRAMLPALEVHGNVLIEDIAVPVSRLGEMFAAIRDIEKTFDVGIPTVSHAGDGNLHPNFIYQGELVPERIWQAADAIFRKAIALGGTLTGEHGVGLLKRQWLVDELGSTQWQLHFGIKKLFDPTGILNPGKVFDPSLANLR